MKQSTKKIKVCLVCKKTFSIYRAWLRSGKGGKYCSRECRSLSQRGKRPSSYFRTEKKCQCCGKSFFVKRYRESVAKYCSRKCLSICRGKAMRGQLHPFWKGGISGRDHRSRKLIKELISERGGCQAPGCEKVVGLHGHHDKEWENYPELRYSPENIVVLCYLHHAERHPKQKEMLLYVKKGL